MPVEDPVFSGDQVRHDEPGTFYETIKFLQGKKKTTATRLIPVPGKKAGDKAYFGGLLGQSVIIPVNNSTASNRFIRLGGRIPAPIQSLTN